VLRAEGRTLLVTSHVPSEIDMVCDRSAILNRGELIALDRTVELKESLAGKLYKYRIARSEPSRDLDMSEVRKSQFVGEANIVLATTAIEPALQKKFGAEQVVRGDPALEETFLWLIEKRNNGKSEQGERRV